MEINFNEGQDAFDGDDQLQLCEEAIQFDIENICLTIDKIPVLRNVRLNKVFLPDQSQQLIKYAINIAKEDGLTNLHLGDATAALSLDAERYAYCEDLKFSYSALDYSFIPGLWRPFNKGFLAPVFFKINILDKYSRNPDYCLDLFSETYGVIKYKADWKLNFGINSKKQVILWLGDISNLPIEEQYYLRSENIDSEHDFHSEFYNAQIKAEWSSASERNKLFKLRSTLQEKVNRKYNFYIFHLDSEVGTLILNLDIPIYWEDRHISPVIDSLNQIFVEGFNKKEIESILKNQFKVSKEELNKKGSLKILEIWLASQLGMKDEDIKKILCPFYVLNDYRIIVSHLCSNETRNEKLESIKVRLSLSSNSGNEDLYIALIRALTNTFNLLLEKIEV